MSASAERERPIVGSPRCPYCHSDVARGDDLQVCKSCHAFHHGACWGELGGCAACGEGRGPAKVVLPPVSPARRRRRRWIALLAATAAVLGITYVSLKLPSSSGPWFGSTDPGDAHPATRPEEAASRWASALATPARPERASELTPLLSRDAAALAALEDWDLAADPHASRQRPGTVSVREIDATHAIVSVGGFDYAVVDEQEGAWKIDRVLAPEPTDLGVAGARMRLLEGLEGTTTRSGERLWMRQKLSLFVRVETTVEVRESPEVQGTREWHQELPGGTTAQVRLFGDAFRADAEAVIELGKKQKLVIELRGPASADTIGELFSRMLKTLAITEPVDAPPLELVAAEGCTMLAPSEKDPCETSEIYGVDTYDLETAIKNARETGVPALGELRVPGSVLPWRALYRERAIPKIGGELLVLKGVGIVDGKTRVLRLTARWTQATEAATAARLMAMADSFAPEDAIWPDPGVRTTELPAGAGTMRGPLRWPETRLGNRVTWTGHDGDSLVALVLEKGEDDVAGPVNGKLVESGDLEGGRKFQLWAIADSAERREHVADVARACFATFEAPRPRPPVVR